MRHKGCLLMAVFTLFLGFVAPVWAVHTADPLEESYSQHVLPYYNIGTGFLSFAIFADTSYTDPANPLTTSPGVANVHLYFFDKTCALVRDHLVPLTANDVEFLDLRAPALAGIPNEGVIFADTGAAFSDGGNERFLAYMILVNLADGTLTRIDSIPFSPAGGLPAHWTRYDPFNTVAATFGDSTSLRTTLTFFNAVGGFQKDNSAGLVTGAIDTLREFMAQYGFPRAGDWVTTGTSTTSQVTPGIVELDAYDGDEAFLGSFRIFPNCFERVRLRDVLPVLASGLGHVVAFSLADAGRTECLNGRCAFSGFQETVVEAGGVDLIFSGYLHHSRD